MKPSHKLLAWSLLSVALNSVAFIIPGFHWWNVAGWAASFMVGRTFALNLYARKKARHGRDRTTEEDHPDPQATGSTSPAVYASTSGAGSGWHTVGHTFIVGDHFQLNPHLTDPQDAPVIEEVQSDMPILAARWAKLRFDSNGPYFGPVTDAGAPHYRFDVDADAECHAHEQYTEWFSSYSFSRSTSFSRPPSSPKRHAAPDFDCKCGFYAVHADQLPDHSTYGGIKLLVELSGRVIEHDKGYRAEHQRVLQIITPTCPGCGDPATRVWFNPLNEKDGSLWECGNHTVQSGTGLLMASTLDQVSKQLAVPFGDES
jgi:hypothetical protein